MEKVRKKNYKDCECVICKRAFKSVRYLHPFCSPKCSAYSKTKRRFTDPEGYDPHNPPPKLRRIIIVK